MTTILQPQPGPQTSFLSCSADIAIYGGAAGGGKSHALLMDPLRFSNVPGFYAVIFRKTYPEITNAGGLWDGAMEIYPYARGRPRESEMDWTFPAGSNIAFSHFQHPKQKLAWQGAQICMIGWDELTHFSKDIFFYMLSRNRSICGVRPYIRATCNPDPDSWVKEFIKWWLDDKTGYAIPERSGVIRWFVREGDSLLWYDDIGEAPAVHQMIAKSVTFICASLDDNPALTDKDPTYRSSLMALPLHERERLLGGNWNIRLSAGMYFKRQWFEIVDAAPPGEDVRYWDRASTEPGEHNRNPDWTRGVRMRKGFDGYYYVMDVESERARPHGVRRLIRTTASQDGIEVPCVLEQDPGQAGVSDVDALVRYLAGYDVRTKNVTKKKEIRAKPFSAQCEAGNVRLVRGDWNEEYLSELEAFPPEDDEIHDDQVDASSGAFIWLAGDEDGSINIREVDL
jgi:predicted phage terminase large subunit-like protein